MAVSDRFDDVQKIYLAFYQRPADPAGLYYWAQRVEVAGGDITKVIEAFAESAEATALYGKIDETTIGTVIDSVYKALFGVAPDEAGKQFYVDGFKAGAFGPGTIALNILNGAQNDDLIAIMNKLEASALFTKTLDPELDGLKPLAKYEGDADAVAAREWLAAVTNTQRVTEAEVKTFVEKKIADAGDPILGGSSGATTLTLGQDTLVGADGVDQTFEAPVVQNTLGSGGLTNTLETGDVVDGGANSANALNITMIPTIVGVDDRPVAISPAVTNVQTVNVRAQEVNVGSGTNTALASIDAEKFADVARWNSVDSRANVRIEDIREVADGETVAFGVVRSDAAVDFEAYFNGAYLKGGVNNISSMTLTLVDNTNPADELKNISVHEINFKLNGKAYKLKSDAIQNANTYTDLVDGMRAALADQPELKDLTVNLQAGNSIVITDPANGAFESVGAGALVLSVINGITVSNSLVQGVVVPEVRATEVDVTLDHVGSGGQGGLVNVGAMDGDRGVEVINLSVAGDSHLQALTSQNAPLAGIGRLDQHLREVNVAHADKATGALTIGASTRAPNGDLGTVDDRVSSQFPNPAVPAAPAQGLLNVLRLNAAEFGADLKVAANIDNRVVNKYLEGAKEPVKFQYDMGKADSNLNLSLNEQVAAHANFEMAINGGAGDDRVDLTTTGTVGVNGPTFQKITIDGGEGNDVLEVTTSVGNNASNTFAGVSGIEAVEVAGTAPGAVTINAASLADVKQFTVTRAGGTTFDNLDADQKVQVSGKVQTLASANHDANQTFGNLAFTNTKGATLDLLLDNTASTKGNLDITNLSVDGQVRTLNLENKGINQTTVRVQDLDAAAVTTLNLKGTQEFRLNVDALASTPANAGATIDASGLSGKLLMAVDADAINNRAADSIRGGSSKEDHVLIRGTMGTSGAPATANTATSISDVESLQFGFFGSSASNSIGEALNVAASQAAGGVFNAANVKGVDTYIVANVDAAEDLSLQSLAGGVTVQLGDKTASSTHAISGNDLTLALSGTGGEVKVDALNTLEAAQFGNNATDFVLTAGNFSKLTFDLDRSHAITTDATAAETLGLNLVTDREAPLREFVLTGGNKGLLASAKAVNVNFNAGSVLDATLDVIDLQNFHGDVVLANWTDRAGDAGDHSTIKVNAGNFAFNMGAGAVVNHAVNGGAANVREVQTIDFTAVGNLTDGQTVTIDFAGGTYTYTHSGAAIAAGTIQDRIVQSIVNNPETAPDEFTISQGANPGILKLEAKFAGNLSDAQVSVNGGAPLAVVEATVGDIQGVNVATKVQADVQDFITTFEFNVDAAKKGKVWKVENIQIDSQADNVATLSNATRLDLKALGGVKAGDIKVEAANAFWTALGAGGQQAYTDEGHAAGDFAAGNSVVTIDGMNFTLLVVGVDAATLVASHSTFGIA